MDALVRLSREPRHTDLRQVPRPQAGPGQVLVAVEAAGVCGSDIEFHEQQLDASSRLQPPVVLGHEGTGRIAELGPGVGGLELGQRVVAETTYSTCGRCQFCQRGELNLCPERKGLGTGANGFFAPYVVAPAAYVHAIPDGVSAVAAAITEPLACAVHAVVEKAELAPGNTAVVFGPGPMGLMVALVAQAVGARCLLVGTAHSRPRLCFAEGRKLAQTLSVDAPGFLAALKSSTDGGADAVFECSGRRAAFDLGLDVLRSGGRLVVLGEISEPVTLDTRATLLRRELLLTGSKSSIPSSWKRAIGLLPQVAPALEAMVSHRFPLQQWRASFEVVRSKEGLKVVLIPGGPGEP